MTGQQVKFADVDRDMIPFTTETYDYATGERLDRVDVTDAGVVAVKGWGRPVVIAVTYWKIGEVHLVTPSGDPREPYQRLWTIGPDSLVDVFGEVGWKRGWVWFEHP